MTEKLTGLALLRAKFPDHQISKLPKPTAAQTKAVKDDFKAGIRCKLCGAWHHPDVVHLDYVGHAALTDRLLDVDPEYICEPMAYDETGLPAFDKTGGLWVKLTVLGVTRMGYGHAAMKVNADPGNREKEIIGDAMRNAAMRFGAALDLWHKGDLHGPDDEGQEEKPAMIDSAQISDLQGMIEGFGLNLGKILQHYKITQLTQIPAEEFANVKRQLNLWNDMKIKQESEKS